MKLKQAKKNIQQLLSQAGIDVNGSHPWDIRVHDESFYHAAVANGSLGVGEAYMNRVWDCAQLDEFFARVLRITMDKRFTSNWKFFIDTTLTRIFNRQSRSRAFRAGQKHYDLDNYLFESMLDKRMVYTCAYWKTASTLDEAQEDKLDLVCRKIELLPGQHILDVGCGWGSFAKYASEKYGARVTGITVSNEQVALATELCKGNPVEIKLMDYRSINEKFDHVVSLGMFEHVGVKNYRTYMKVIHRCLKENGLFLLHTIGRNTSGTTNDPWISKYIFPASVLPSIKQIGNAIEGLFVMEDWQNFSADYDKTLMAWYNNFVTHWQNIRHRYDERFFRMWKYYLLMCAGTFRARKNQLWQIVLSKNGVAGGYTSVR